jgi:site-specific recombinase XerD
LNREGIMEIADLLARYRRFLKRRNCSFHTVKNYMSILGCFTTWNPLSLSLVTHKEIGLYVGHLLKTRKPKTINCHLEVVRSFFDYLIDEEGIVLINPVRKGHKLRLPRPLPKHLKDDQIPELFDKIKDKRDRAMFMTMLRCGLRVDEVAHLTMNGIEFRKRTIFVSMGKGGKDRIVYISNDAQAALQEYLKSRESSEENRVFLVQKGPLTGKPISVRGIQKRIEYYSKKSGIALSCHHLRHTMATQLLNADADIVTIQDLLGHSRVTTTQRYCRVSNLKVQRDYFKSITVVIQRSQQAAVDGLGMNHFMPTAVK